MDGGWLDYLSAFGTAAAAVLAGVAALIAAWQGKATREMVVIERTRDADRREEERTAQSRRVMLDEMQRYFSDEHGQIIGADVFLVVRNGSADPIHKVRLRPSFGGRRHGPQLVGSIAPGAKVTALVHIRGTGDVEWAPSRIRFVDVRNQAWILTSKGELKEDTPDGLEAWIEEGRDFAREDHDSPQIGILTGTESMPDPDGWRSAVESLSNAGAKELGEPSPMPN
jgi:hypothetical protein